MSTSEPWTVGRLLAWTGDYLKTHGSESPRLDAEVLLSHVLGCQRIGLYTAFDDLPGDEVRTAFRDLVRRRAEGTPVAYLVGHREFYSLSFRVTPDVLIPRPETELLVVGVLDLAKTYFSLPVGEGSAARSKSLAIADVGTGSGIIAVCLAKHLPESRVSAIDISRQAIAIARENAEKHGVAERIEFIHGDLFAALPPDRQFDFIASNPPYVKTCEMDQLAVDVRKFEPRQALEAGPNGAEVIERLISQSGDRLRPGGHLLIEIGPAIHDAVLALLQSDARFDVGPTIKDLARLPRVVQAQRRRAVA